ncbi:DUF4358 domain-containing protein [Paenibacillus radicibacter]|uniref:DUF4358 domain-containing protein n=1 Tax=Paenibacillus radicibacter TaxID=2972488 RepID=UPI002159ABB3|nr:DUF4358 domain-containing protein [Paenibacillus radicibacter]
MNNKHGTKWIWGLPQLFILTVVVLIGCSNEVESIRNASSQEIVEHMKQSVKLGEMKEGDRDKLEKLYHLNSDEIEDFALYTASSNVEAQELLVIRTKKVEQVGNVTKQIKKRMEAQATKFKDYRPEEYALIQSHVLKTIGPYVLLAVSADAEKIGSAFEEALKSN